VTTVFTQIVVWLNQLAGACAAVLLAPLAVLPGWLSATGVAAVTGALMLLAFKYTSNQTAVKQARAASKANLLALSLFKDSMVVSLKCQGRVLWGAGRLVSLALAPMAVLCVPTCLLLSQLALWYQARPLRVGEEAVVTAHLAGGPGGGAQDLRLVPSAAVKLIAGPVRVANERMICWNVQAQQPGYQRLTFSAGRQTFDKQLAVGEGFMRVSSRRPAWRWADAALSPGERPFPADSLVEAVEVAYPQRSSWTAGTDSWLVYWFAASMAFAFALRPVLRVNL
jgi:hypothetical protein